MARREGFEKGETAEDKAGRGGRAAASGRRRRGSRVAAAVRRSPLSLASGRPDGIKRGRPEAERSRILTEYVVKRAKLD